MSNEAISPQRSIARDDDKGPSPQKVLNANAKAFQPRLDGASIHEAQEAQKNLKPIPTPTSSRSQPTPARPPILPFVGAPPGFFAMQPPAVPMPMLIPPGISQLNRSLTSLGPPLPSPFVPPSPMFFAPPPSPSVNVGNASLAALRSKEPPKFCCVILVGLPSTGKTTIGREVVASLNADDLQWSFFSGSDHLKEGERRPPFWESTKEVFGALEAHLDNLLAKQSTSETRIKGLLIDKNCRSVEDLLYLASVLKTKQLPLVGVVSLESKDDEPLLRRMGTNDEALEKLRFHRVIQARIVESARSAGLYRGVDATKGKEIVAQAVRTMVLGCSAQPSHVIRPISWSSYSESMCPPVESYVEYCNVMTTLFSLVKPATGTTQWWDNKFPAFTDYTPLSLRELEDSSKIASLKAHFSVRRKVDGTKHLCVFDGQGLYLVPRHMRSVLRLSAEAWLGMQISNMGRFVLDGDLARLTKDRTKEKFVAYDVLFWSDSSNPLVNLVRLASWKERQERLASSICHEASAFYQKSTDCVVVHQRCEPWEKALDLLEPLDYPSDGLIFQPHQSTQPTYMWRPPQAITCDLRLGSVLSCDALDAAATEKPGEFPVQTIKIFAVESYDKDLKKYVRLANEKVEVRRNDVVEGCICICGLHFDNNGDHHWTFHRARYDVSRAAYKSAVDDLIQHCLIARARLVQWLIAEKFVSQKDMLLGSATQSDVATSMVSRVAFGSALGSAESSQVSQQKKAATRQNNLEMLQRVVPSGIKVQSSTKERSAPSLQMLESVVGAHVNVVRAEPHDKEKEPSACAECGKPKKSEDLRRDNKDDKLYCYACWANSGVEFCTDCGEFRKGHRETSRKQLGAFYCEPCWENYNSKVAETSTKVEKSKPKRKDKPTVEETVSVEEVKNDDSAAEKKRRRRGGRGRRKKNGDADDESGSEKEDKPQPQETSEGATKTSEGATNADS